MWRIELNGTETIYFTDAMRLFRTPLFPFSCKNKSIDKTMVLLFEWYLLTSDTDHWTTRNLAQTSIWQKHEQNQIFEYLSIRFSDTITNQFDTWTRWPRKAACFYYTQISRDEIRGVRFRKLGLGTSRVRLGYEVGWRQSTYRTVEKLPGKLSLWSQSVNKHHLLRTSELRSPPTRTSLLPGVNIWTKVSISQNISIICTEHLNLYLSEHLCLVKTSELRSLLPRTSLSSAHNI